jgi:hypothetical protein
MALAYRLDAISQGPKNSRIPGPNPLLLALIMDMHASKTLYTWLYFLLYVYFGKGEGGWGKVREKV